MIHDFRISSPIKTNKPILQSVHIIPKPKWDIQNFNPFIALFQIHAQISIIWANYDLFQQILSYIHFPVSVIVLIIVELLEWKSSGSGQENRINDRGDPLRWPRDTLYPQ
jgi:hypothetical protein